jgi:hypothetical protein
VRRPLSPVGIEVRSRPETVRRFYLDERARRLSSLSSGSGRGHHLKSQVSEHSPLD